MICQNCKKHTATTFMQKTINGKTAALYLCPECAAKQNLSLWNGFDLDNFWGSLFTEPSARAIAESVRCEGCGHSFRDIASSGKAGCPTCYTTFYDRLLPSIERIHGKAHHVGKTPSGTADIQNDKEELATLKKQLQECIDKQEYERCAELRDRIHELESKNKE